MTNWGYDDNDNATPGNETELDGPRALREAYAALKKQNEETTAMVKELLEEKKSAQLATVFESLGIPEAKKVYQGPADPEAAKAWAESMRAVFGGNQGGNPNVAAQPQEQPPALSQEQQAQFQRMTEAGQHGTPMGNLDAAYAAVGDATDIQSLIAGFQNATRTNG